jgi:hypothetical protein
MWWGSAEARGPRGFANFAGMSGGNLLGISKEVCERDSGPLVTGMVLVFGGMRLEGGRRGCELVAEGGFKEFDHCVFEAGAPGMSRWNELKQCCEYNVKIEC